METEGKAKVVASVRGAKFVQVLVALAVLPWSICKKRLNSMSLVPNKMSRRINMTRIKNIYLLIEWSAGISLAAAGGSV